MAIIAQQVPKEVFENLKWVEMNIQDVIFGGQKADESKLQALLELKVSYTNELPEKGEREYIL